MQSYIILISTMIIWGTIGIFRRYIPLSSSLLAFLRGIIGAGFLLLLLKFQGKELFSKLKGKQARFFMLTGAIIGINWILLFEAYNSTTVSIATLCYSMQPTLTIILSALVLHEALTIKKLCCTIFSVTGISLVCGITESSSISMADSKGIYLGLSAAFLYALVVILNKKIKDADAYEQTIIQLTSAAIILLPYLFFTENFTSINLDIQASILIFLLCIVHTGIAYACYFSCLNKMQAQSVAILSYIDPVTALLLSALILHEHLTAGGIIGAVLIIGSALISEIKVKVHRF